MSSRRPNPRLVKIHRNYSVEEIALLYSVHKNTVRLWIKEGLRLIDDSRPAIVLGRDLFDYLVERRNKNKSTCQPNELYCLRCRKPQTPAGNMADYEQISEKVGNLIGICPACDAIINKRVSREKLSEISMILDISFPKALKHIGDTTHPSLNSDFNRGRQS